MGKELEIARKFLKDWLGRMERKKEVSLGKATLYILVKKFVEELDKVG